MPTKSGNGDALLYINNNINYKLRPDLNAEKEKQLELIFIEILQKTSKNILAEFTGIHLCIWKNLMISF